MPRQGNTTTASNSAASSRHDDDLILLMFFFIVFELFVGIFCTWQQMTTTHDSIFGLLQAGTIVPSHATPQQVIYVMTGAEDKNNKIAYTIAFVTQVMFLSCFLPNPPIRNKKIRNGVVAIFFMLEVASDLWYSVATGTTMLGAFTWIFSWGSGGWLASLCYIVAMTAGSTLCVVDGFGRLTRLVLVLIGRR